jgi:hypothetical protein
MSYDIIIARYNESLEWTKYLHSSTHIIVYNKGIHDISNIPNKQIIPLPNKGREGNTFLHHIIEHYDHLPDFLILVQGNPFDHMNPAITPMNFQENLDYLMNHITTIYPLFTIKYKETITYPGIKAKEYYRFIFGEPVPEIIEYAPGSQYIIPKQSIYMHSRSFYQNINEMLLHSKIVDYHIAHYHDIPFDPYTIHGWCLERLFYYLFSSSSSSTIM